MTFRNTYEKDPEAVSQRCFYGKLFLKYATIYAECAYFMDSFSLEHLSGSACENTNTSKFQRIFSDLQIAFETICFEMNMFWHVASTEYYHVLII